ncbi:MAG: HEAT repeat domain-containing protein [Nitrospiraceae bacterium]
MIRSTTFFLLLAYSLITSGPASAQSSIESAAPIEEDSRIEKQVVYLDAETTTWRSRGRVSFGIIPSLKTKLTAAGFAVSQDPERPHDMTLIVRYHEKRGRQISLNLYGTDIHCAMTLEHSRKGRMLDLTIDEAPDYAELITAPYIEVVDKFQANPYFHFLGELIRDRLDLSRDSIESLITALNREMYPAIPVAVTPLDTLVSPAETFPNLDDHFSSIAWERAIDELGRVKDPRAVELLLKSASHPDHRVRLHAVLALEGFTSPSVVSTMTRVAQSDTDVSVRNAAKAVLARLANR